MKYRVGVLILVVCIATAGVAGMLVMESMDHNQSHACVLVGTPQGDCPPDASAIALATHHASVLEALVIGLPIYAFVLLVLIIALLFLVLGPREGVLKDKERFRSVRQRFYTYDTQYIDATQRIISWLSLHNKRALPNAYTWALGATVS